MLTHIRGLAQIDHGKVVFLVETRPQHLRGNFRDVHVEDLQYMVNRHGVDKVISRF